MLPGVLGCLALFALIGSYCHMVLLKPKYPSLQSGAPYSCTGLGEHSLLGFGGSGFSESLII